MLFSQKLVEENGVVINFQIFFVFLMNQDNTPLLKYFVKIILSGVDNEASLSLIILMHISSQPCALFGLTDPILASIFSSEPHYLSWLKLLLYHLVVFHYLR